MSARLYPLRQRNGGERVDTSRQCCDARCVNQGRDNCPLVDRKPADPFLAQREEIEAEYSVPSLIGVLIVAVVAVIGGVYAVWHRMSEVLGGAQ